VRERHCSRHYFAATAGEPASLNDIGAGTKLFDKLRDVSKIVAVVRIAHEDVPAARRRDSTHERIAVTFFINTHDARAHSLCDRRRFIGAAVVGNNDLAADTMLAKGAPRFIKAGRKSIAFIQAGHHDGNFDIRRRG
jgi:hypothetical protein